MKYLLITLYWVSLQNGASPVSAVHEYFDTQAQCETMATAIKAVDKERLTGRGYKVRVNTFCVPVAEAQHDAAIEQDPAGA